MNEYSGTARDEQEYEAIKNIKVRKLQYLGHTLREQQYEMRLMMQGKQREKG